MIPRPRRSLRALHACRVVLVGTILVLLPRAALADRWYEHYGRAEEALEAEEWLVAVEELNQAISRKSDSEARARTYGMKVTSYFPYFCLGKAYLALGRPDAALGAFETEEGFGEILEDRSAHDAMEQERSRAQRLIDRERRDEERRIEEIVSAGRERAGALAGEGRWEDALEEMGPALAVAPDDPSLLELHRQLQQGFAAQQRGRAAERQRELLVEEGERALREGRPDEAASRFREAQAMRSDPNLEALLLRAREDLRRRRDATDAAERSRLLAERLSEAREADRRGDFQAALHALEAALILDPDDADARALEEQLIAKNASRREAEAIEGLVLEQLRLAEDALRTRGPQEGLTYANRALALEPGNVEAQQLASRAYREINSELLDSDRRQNLPPTVRFFDNRVAVEGEERREITERSRMQLSGLVVDESEVEITAFLGALELPVEVRTESRGEQVLTHFRLAPKLSPGLADLVIDARDPEGASSTSSYQVLYAPPLHRRPLFYGVLLALLGSVGAVVLLRRNLERRSRLARRFNPYVAGAPILDRRRFFGRERLLDRVLQAVPNNSLMLFGERRIGKTSFQHMLKRELENTDDPEWTYYPVYIDVQGVREEDFFSTLAEEIRSELAPVLGVPSDLDSPRSTVGGVSAYRDLVREIRWILVELSARTTKKAKLVLLIDEVDELNRYDPRTNQRLRSLFMKSFAENLVAVVSGVQIHKRWDREGSPWYNFFEEIEVPPLDAEPAHRLVREPIKGVFDLEPGLVERITEMAGGKPYLIQGICRRLVHRVHEEKRRRITLADLDAIELVEET